MVKTAWGGSVLACFLVLMPIVVLCEDRPKFKILESCLGKKNEKLEALSGHVQNGDLANLNPKCDQQMLLREGVNIEIINYLTTKNTFSLVYTACKKEGSLCSANLKGKPIVPEVNEKEFAANGVQIKIPNFEKLKKDGVCLDTDHTLSNCYKRLEALVLDTEVRTRGKIEEYNTARREIVSEGLSSKQSKHVDRSLLDLETSDEKPTGLLYDVDKLGNVADKKTNNQYRDIMKVRAVSFGKADGLEKPGDLLLDPTKTRYKKTKLENLSDTNPAVATQLGEDALEVGTGEEEKGIKQKLTTLSNSKDLKEEIEKYQKDQRQKAQKKRSDIIQEFERRSTDQELAEDTTTQAFKMTVYQLRKSAAENKKTLDQVDAARIPLSHSPKLDKKNSPTVDESVQESIDNVSENYPAGTKP